MTNPKKSDITRAKILEAAIVIFSEKGPDGARIDEIAEKADINKQRIYAYFGSKDKLFTKVLQECFRQAAELDKSLLELNEEDIPNLTGKLLEHFFLTHEQYPEFRRMLAWENLCGGKHLDAIPDYQSRGYEHIRKLFEKGKKKGLYAKEVSFSAYLLALTGVSFFYFSNSKTMSRTLGTELLGKSNPAKFRKQLSQILTPLSYTSK